MITVTACSFWESERETMTVFVVRERIRNRIHCAAERFTESDMQVMEPWTIFGLVHLVCVTVFVVQVNLGTCRTWLWVCSCVWGCVWASGTEAAFISGRINYFCTLTGRSVGQSVSLSLSGESIWDEKSRETWRRKKDRESKTSKT